MARILPVFLPFAACGNRCLFCDQNVITGVKGGDDIFTSALIQIDDWLKIGGSWDEVAFYGGNFGAIEKSSRVRLYSLAEKCGDARVRFSTRPDTITPELIEEIKNFDIKSVELGVQSLDDEVLKANGRPYKAADVFKAIKVLSEVTSCGVQLMTGMYGQSAISALDDAKTLSAMPVASARIYPTQVLKGTGLFSYMERGLYKPARLNETILIATGMYIFFKSADIEVIRMGLPEDSLSGGSVAGPRHEAFGDIVKTLAVMLYFETGGQCHFAGYKGMARKAYPQNFSKEGEAVNFNIICRHVRRVFLEDSKRFLEGKAACFAERFESSSYNG